VILRESVIFGSTIEFEGEIKQKSGSTFYHSLCLGQLIDRYKLKIVLGCGKREFPDKIWLGLVCWSYPRTEVLIISMWKTGYLHRWQTRGIKHWGGRSKTKLSVKQKSTLQRYLPLIDMKGQYKCFICSDNNVGLHSPNICETMGQNIWLQ